MTPRETGKVPGRHDMKEVEVDIEAMLSEAPLLAELDVKTRRRLSEQGKHRSYKAGEYVVRQGDPASALYIMLTGRVRVEQEADGKVETLTDMVPYSFFGEVALIEDTPRTASVKAVEDTDCLLIPSWEFTALVKEYPDVSDVVLRELIRRLYRREHLVL
jgi:CRP/FNR family cyclic AMP-dependent transcriptional regulator